MDLLVFVFSVPECIIGINTLETGRVFTLDLWGEAIKDNGSLNHFPVLARYKLKGYCITGEIPEINATIK